VFRTTWFVSSVAALLMAVAAGCASSEQPPAQQPVCRDSPGDDVKMAVRTGVAGAKTGVKTGVEGVKTAGRAAAGFVEGGSGEASREWNAGKRTPGRPRASRPRRCVAKAACRCVRPSRDAADARKPPAPSRCAQGAGMLVSVNDVRKLPCVTVAVAVLL
jgi:hypothetical protein